MNRRIFLESIAATGAMVFAVWLREEREATAFSGHNISFSPSFWFRLESHKVVCQLARCEMGQGVIGALPMIIADELEVPWEWISVEQAPLDPQFGRQQTSASQSIFSAWLPLRTAAAAAREMLIEAAAQTWRVSREQCRGEEGAVFGPGTKRVQYGELLDAASRLAIPKNPRLKDPSNWKLIGRAAKRPDIPAKVDGSALFGADVRLSNMAYAAILHAPRTGAEVQSYDAEAIISDSNVIEVVNLRNAVAVVASSYWLATQAIKKIKVKWTIGTTCSSEQIRRDFDMALRGKGVVAFKNGSDQTQASIEASASYEVPFLAHACLEPVTCTAIVSASGCTIWAPTQSPSRAREQVAKQLNRSVSDVQLHQTFLGGGFGRKTVTDYILETISIAQKVNRPVQLIWSREQDIKHDHFRPACTQYLHAGLSASGEPLYYSHHLAAPSVMKWWRPEAAREEVDWISIAGAGVGDYDIPNVEVRWHEVEVGVPVGILRSIAHSYTCFARECFVNEMAHLSKINPLEYRLRMLTKSPRACAVLQLAAAHGGWAGASQQSSGRGLALHTEHLENNYNVFFALIAEVELVKKSQVKVKKITCACDVGVTVSPDGLRAQIEGGIMFGLTAALKGLITLDRGEVVQGNFDDYQMLRIHDAPEIEIHLVDSIEQPAGAGEKAVPPVAPAIANAIFAITGKPIRKLPMVLE